MSQKQPTVLNEEEIDEILDELEQRENENSTFIDHDNDDLNSNWNEILKEMRNNNINYIKNLITSNIDINSQNPANGKTLLIYAVITCNFDLVKTICDFGADVGIKDHNNMDAVQYGMKYGIYKITELLYYRQLSGSLGNDIRNIGSQIHKKNKEAQNMRGYEKRHFGSVTNLERVIISYLCQAIAKRNEIGTDLLYYGWYFYINDKNNENPFSGKLWKAMMKTFEAILCDTSDKNGWKWLRSNFLNSLIWFLPHPQNTKHVQEEKEIDDEDVVNDMNNILRKTLFHELLIRVRNESKKQSDLLLKDKINKIKLEKPDVWKELISFNINTKYSKNARQDIAGCIIPKYKEHNLSEQKYPPSTHFNAKKHYDTRIFLNEILFRGNVIDSEFQNDMKRITKKINFETGDTVTYRAGPVKTLKRSQEKVGNDYINEDWPTSAKILDVNRCAIEFKSIESMMKFFKIFINKVNNNKCGSIIDVIRCKNGWSIYNPDYAQYTDIKINVLCKSSQNGHSLICEAQFLLSVMSAFKKKAHKLYAIERKYELVYSYGKLQNEMKHFKDHTGINGVIINLAKKDDFQNFQLLWNSINRNKNTLIDDLPPHGNFGDTIWDAAIFIIMLENKKINSYLVTEYADLYYETILNYIKLLYRRNLSAASQLLDCLKQKKKK
eukprot:301944_1